MHRLHSEATGISYLTGEERNAPLVICLHGFPDIPRTWSSLADELTAAGHRVVLPWLPGYAPSSLDGPFDLPSLALKIMALIDELSPVRPVRIEGHDWGSAITKRVCRALLASVSTRPRGPTTRLPLRRGPVASLVAGVRSGARLLRRAQAVLTRQHASAARVLQSHAFAPTPEGVGCEGSNRRTHHLSSR